MRYVRTDAFKADYKKLSAVQKDLFKEAVNDFPAALRVRDVEGARGVFEMTWSFKGPDGRATWEWGEVEVQGPTGVMTKERAVVWRRVGSHRIFSRP